jgi:hypothetical protein
MSLKARPLAERFYSGLEPCTDPGCSCILWGGVTNKGYGVIKAAGRGSRNLAVHRLAWELEKGPIPDGLTIDHVKARGCRHTTCCNIAHLEPVTMRVNCLRGMSPHAINAAKTHCDHGHEFDLFNTAYRHGLRRCRTCHREEERRRYAARKAAA